MKKTILANLMILGITGITIAGTANASNYPPDYCSPRVNVRSDGPAFLADVRSGCSSTKYVIGYKASGMFRSQNAVDALISVRCRSYEGYEMTVSPVFIRLGREWHGTGFLSGSISEGDSIFSACRNGYVGAISIAFLAEGQWDSRYGANYYLDTNRTDASYKSNSVNGYEIPLDIWDFIVDQMRR
ncbi:MAG TPA: hypothetical protein VJB59_08800 [Bdellovibrionota bacterium]|nr:hypothetical protein [Bdellovibrionota bacterium]